MLNLQISGRVDDGNLKISIPLLISDMLLLISSWWAWHSLLLMARWPCAQWLMRRRVSPAVTRGYLHIYIRTLIDFRPALNNNISIKSLPQPFWTGIQHSKSHYQAEIALMMQTFQKVNTRHLWRIKCLNLEKERKNKLDYQLSGPVNSIFR